MSGIIGEGELRRFFTTAEAVENSVKQSDAPSGGWRIELDGRPVKTPLGKIFVAPTQALACRVTDEWNDQGDKIIPASMPITSLANAATDRIQPDPQYFIDQLIGYARSDLLCYWADSPDDLVLKQREFWLPILDWVDETFNARFTHTTGVIPVEQPPEALAALHGIIQELDEFYITGLLDIAGAMSSVMLALTIWKQRLSPEQAYHAAFLDEVFQEELWGEDYDAQQRRKIIRTDILATAEFLSLLDLE